MQHTDAVRLIRRTFESAYDETNLRTLVAELFHGAENRDKVYSGAYIPAAYRDHISSYKYICKYISPDQEQLAVLAVNCSKVDSLEKARTLQRNFVANYMKERNRDACIVAFYSDEDRSHWRFSFVRIDNSFNFDTLNTQDIITPAKRFSYMVGEKEASHTAQQQLCMLLEDNGKRHTIDEIESAFAIEKISDQFFMDYKLKFIELVEYMEQLRKTNTNLNSHFVLLNISNELFCKKLLGQIVFLYFLQKKGWLGVSLDKQWGDGDKRFLANLFLQADSKGLNYFNDCLEPLFYEALAEERKDHVYKPLGCKIPFLNGGLFDPVGKYDWKHTIISIPNEIFKNGRDGILDIFDRYNFTVREDEPLEKEVAVDPEMLGKVFENLLEVKDRKSKGAFYTPREIVHYMCQQSLIQYLNTKLSGQLSIPDIEFFIKYGDIYSELQDKYVQTHPLPNKIPEQLSKVKPYAEKIDESLANVKICDPAVGSGAFPVGMMHEIIRARQTLLDAGFLKRDKKRTIYEYKRQIIKDSIYGVDIEDSAIEIAKLRLWLSLIVDEDSKTAIRPLPNLDFKMIKGDSLNCIDKNKLNLAMLQELESIKGKYFDSYGREKANYTRQLKKIASHLTSTENFDLTVIFSDILKANKGFDIVIGNPPYIDSETMVKDNPEIRNLYSKKYKSAVGNWDIFVLFFERGLNITNGQGTIGFIVPNKLLSKNYASTIRKMISERGIIEIRDYSKVPVFVSAAVYPITIILGGRKIDYVSIGTMRNIITQEQSSLVHNNAFTDASWDVFFSEDKSLSLITKIKRNFTKTLGKEISFESPASVADAYAIKPVIVDNQMSEKCKKFVNSGTIDRYETQWGKKKTAYIKDTYEFPVIANTDIVSVLNERRYTQSSAPKLIIANMTKNLEVFLDCHGDYCAGKSTVIALFENKNDDMYFYAGILNSKWFSFLYKAYNHSSKMSGGALSVTADRLSILPMANFSEKDKENIKKLVELIITLKYKGENTLDIEKDIDKIVYDAYSLSKDEIEIIENNY